MGNWIVETFNSAIASIDKWKNEVHEWSLMTARELRPAANAANDQYVLCRKDAGFLKDFVWCTTRHAPGMFSYAFPYMSSILLAYDTAPSGIDIGDILLSIDTTLDRPTVEK